MFLCYRMMRFNKEKKMSNTISFRRNKNFKGVQMLTSEFLRFRGHSIDSPEILLL